jgi:hypothetical protein
MLYIYILYFLFVRRCARVGETGKIAKQALKVFFIL